MSRDLQKQFENKNATEEQKQENPEKETTLAIGDYLAAIPGAPTEDQIEQWKQQLGEVLCSGFSETEIFVWRPVTRAEFVSLQVTLSQGEFTQYDFEEKLVETCVLWASPLGQESLQKKAGSMSTLQEQIMQNSNFMNPAMASALVIKL